MSVAISSPDQRPLRFPGARRTAWCAALSIPLVLGPIWVCLVSPISATLAGTLGGFILAILLCVSSYTDFRWHRIPNWATYPAMLWALVLNAIPGSLFDRLGGIGLSASLSGMMVCFGVMLLVYRVAGGGAGDVKLAAAVGALLGLQRGLVAIFWCYVLAATIGLIVAAWRVGPLRLAMLLLRQLGATLAPAWVAPPSDTDREILVAPVPLGLFFALGTLMSLLGVTP
jgi:prepilin signal peptidase PulO-like enzyme (type II secretory pathway)